MRTEPTAWLLCLGLFAACQGAAEEETASPAPDADLLAVAPAPELETFAACNSAPASFAVSPGTEVGGPMVGFGAQFNANLYHPSGRFSQGKLAKLEGMLAELRPQHVRIFFDSRAFRDATYMTSFSRTVALAQRTGATVNVTYWHGPYKGAPGTADFGKTEMDGFAAALKREFDAGHSAIKYVTVQNEPNRTKFNSHKKDLVQLYKNLHTALGARGIRNRVELIPEITRGYPGTESYFKGWLEVIGAGAGDIIDGYAFHIYWDHDMWDLVRAKRIKEIKDVIQGLPAAQRKPVYVTEFGTRGEPDANKRLLPWPGWSKKNCTTGRKGCKRIVDTTTAGANNAYFQVTGARAGFRAFVYWDAYWTMYDKSDQRWSMIGRPSDGLSAKPTYFVQQLLSHAVGRGWVPVSVSDPGRQHLRSTALKGDGKLTVLGVNKSTCATMFRYSGLPAGARFYQLVWNDNGSGTICSRGLTTAVGGKLAVAVHARSLVALSTRAPGLTVPSCGRSVSSVPPDMCGDGVCSEGETDANCGKDCGCGAANACGTVAPFGCYCNETCEANGDCCADAEVCQ